MPLQPCFNESQEGIFFFNRCFTDTTKACSYSSSSSKHMAILLSTTFSILFCVTSQKTRGSERALFTHVTHSRHMISYCLTLLGSPNPIITWKRLITLPPPPHRPAERSRLYVCYKNATLHSFGRLFKVIPLYCITHPYCARFVAPLARAQSARTPREWKVSYEAKLKREKNSYLLLNKHGDLSFFQIFLTYHSSSFCSKS